PWTKHGYKDATTNPTKVACFDWKGASIGIATGSSSNIDILDVDLHGGDGFETLKALGLALPDTLIASTPRQGRHYFFHHVEGSRSRRLGPALEWFADGKFVVVPPAQGRSWINANPIAEAPNDLTESVMRKEKDRGRQRETSASPMATNTPLPYSLYLLLLRQMPLTQAKRRDQRCAGTILAKLVRLTEGRNTGLFNSTLGFRELVERGVIEPGAACTLLVRACELNGYVAKDGIEAVKATIMSALGLKAWPPDGSIMEGDGRKSLRT